MNVNTNMNVNNVPASQVTGGTANNQQISMNKNDFLKMLKMLMAENQSIPQLGTAEATPLNLQNPDILLLMAGNGMLSNRNLKDAIYPAEDVANNIGNPEATKKPAADKTQADLYGMAYMHNPAIDSNIMDFLMPGTNISPDVYAENTAYNMPESAYLQPYAGLTYTNQFQSTRQPDSDNPLQLTGLETQDAPENQIKKATDVHSFSAEKLISQIEDNRSSLKNEIDFKANLLMANARNVEQGHNHIITVSDEASEIKPQIMSQVAEKIVFTAEEEPGAEGRIKYVTMELQPHDLGKVDIKMVFEGDKLTVEIKALNKETQKILQSNAKELTDILSKGTKMVVDVIVKDNYNQYENHAVNNAHNNRQQEQHNYNQNNNDEARQQERNKDGNYHRGDSDKDEEGIFSQMINLRNIKLSS